MTHRLSLLALALTACGSGKGGVEELPNLRTTNVDLSEADSLLAGRSTTEAGPLPADAGGPAITDVVRNATGITGGTTVWTVETSAPTDAILLQFDDEDVVHRFEADGTSNHLVFHYRGELRDAWQTRFAESRDRFCDGNRFVVPDDLVGNTRYTEYYDTLGSILDLLCSGGKFDAGSYVDSDVLSLFFPRRAAGSAAMVAESGGAAGALWEGEVVLQRIQGGSEVVSLFFNQDTDLDLHVVEDGGTEIYYGNTSSDAGGELNLDSNPACSIDGVNNEHIYWDPAPSGAHAVRLSYYEACVNTTVRWAISTVQGDDLTIYDGTLGPEHEGGMFQVADFVVP